MGLWRTEPDGRSVWTIGNVTQKLKEASLRQHAAAQSKAFLKVGSELARSPFPVPGPL